MIVCCATPPLLIGGAMLLFKNSNVNWVWILMMLCPIAHIFMMKGHKKNSSHLKDDEQHRV